MFTKEVLCIWPLRWPHLYDRPNRTAEEECDPKASGNDQDRLTTPCDCRDVDSVHDADRMGKLKKPY